jgi:PleD family two-component response regulator
VRRSIEQTCDEFVIEKGFPHLSRALTASCGIARTSQLVKDKDSLIRAADEALYMAKAQGKNRAVVAG